MTRERMPNGSDKIVLLASLYFAQGLPFGFFHRAVPVLLRQAGYSLAAVGASALLALPWSLKFLWAPLVDRHGSRRTWIVALQAAAALLLCALAFAPPAFAMQAMMGAFFFANLVAATQDIATDGLALDMLTERERGFANGVQVGGYRLGMILGGGGLLVLFEALGWTTSFLLMALLLVVSTMPLLLLRSVPSHAPRMADAATAANASLLGFVRRDGAGAVLALICLYKLGDALGTGMISSFLTDAGLSMSEQGWMLGTVGSIAGMTGALTGGALVTRIGRRESLAFFGMLLSLMLGAYALAAHSLPSREVLYGLAFAEHFASGMATAALFTCMMDWSSPGSATDYTIQACAVVIATGVATSASGVLAQAVGYAAHFGLSAALMLGCTIVAYVLYARATAMSARNDGQQP